MVFIKDVSGNADAGTGTTWGGNDINYLDDYFDDVDITPKIARINTITQFRDNKLYIKDSDNSHSYIIRSGNISANRNVYFPVLGADDTWAFKGIDNSFTEAQTITKGQTDLFYLYRPSSTVNDEVGILFLMNDAAANSTDYARIRARIEDNTNGSEDGELRFATQIAGAITERLKISSADFLITGKSDTADVLNVFRNINTNNSILDINFDMLNSTPTRFTYCDIRTEILDNTAGSEDGAFEINVCRAGTKQQMLQLDRFGVLQVGHDGSNLGSVPRTVIKSGAAVTINTTSAEQTLVTQTIIGGIIGSNGNLRLRMFGTIKQNQVTATTFTLRIKFGGSTIYQDDIASALAQNATHLPYMLDVTLFARNSNTNHHLQGGFWMNDTASVTTGLGDITDDEGQAGQVFRGTSTADITSNQTFAVTIQHSVSDVNVETNVNYYEIVVNPS